MRMDYLDALADSLMSVLEEEAVLLKKADFSQLLLFADRKTKLLEKFEKALPENYSETDFMEGFQKKIRRIETRAKASAQLLEALGFGVNDAIRRINNLDRDHFGDTGAYNPDGEPVDEATSEVSISVNF